MVNVADPPGFTVALEGAVDLGRNAVFVEFFECGI
jgi:hypothetical protein